ncbi:MAG: N-acetylglucosamine-6-phosphate deacetylase [Clostridia bacterium]|nr:N-acetylglucosamine-6-phosphate deacetylase [Clostridia bacterium]
MLIRNGILFMDDRFVTGEEVRVHNGQVREVGHHLEAGLYETIADVQGDYILPGFVDVHIHAFRGHDTMQGADAVRQMRQDLFQEGVAAFCPTTMSASVEDTCHAIEGIRSVMREPSQNGARILGAHLEAPFLQTDKAGAQRKEFFLDPDIRAFDALTGGSNEGICLMTMAPEKPGAEALIRELTGRGIVISVGHTSADSTTVHAAGDWGANHVTHTFNAQTPIHHRKPGVPGAALTDPRFYCEMICDGIHLDADIVRLITLCKGSDRHAVAITDAMEAAGMPDGTYQLGGQAVFVKEGEARLADGTLAGSVLLMRKALENLIHRFGIDPVQAVQMCTANPADSIGEKTAGRLIPGSPAPLTRWSADWRYRGILF